MKQLGCERLDRLALPHQTLAEACEAIQCPHCLLFLLVLKEASNCVLLPGVTHREAMLTVPAATLLLSPIYCHSRSRDAMERPVLHQVRQAGASRL